MDCNIALQEPAVALRLDPGSIQVQYSIIIILLQRLSKDGP